MITDEHGEDVECTPTSVHINSGLILTDSMRVTSVECNTAEYTDNRTKWKYDDTLPHALLVPHPEDRQCVRLYDRVSGHNNVTIEVDIEDRAFTGAEQVQRTREPVDMM